MKTTKVFLAAGLSLAMTLTLSCSEGSFLGGFNFASLTSANALQNSQLGFAPLGPGESIPEDVANDFIESVQISGSALPGGVTYITITSSKQLEELYMQLDLVGEPAGFYRHEVGSVDYTDEKYEDGKWIYPLELMFNQSLGADFRIVISGKTVDGDLVASKEEEVPVKEVEYGDLQVSVAWDINHDVDLYVVTPSKDTIFHNRGNVFRNQPPVLLQTGGTGALDIDSNRDCNPIDGIRSENIFFENPEEGEYEVRLVLYARCPGVEGADGDTRYSITTNVKGQFVNFDSKQSGRFTSTEAVRRYTNIGKFTIEKSGNSYVCTSCTSN